MLVECGVLLTFSLTVNLSVALYCFLVPLAKYLLATSRRRAALRILQLLREQPSLVRKTCRDQIFTVLLFVYGTVLLARSDILQNPLRNSSQLVLTAFAIDVGHYVYKCHQDFLLRSELPFFKLNLLHHVVTATTYMVLIITEQNGISGVVGLLFEGSVAVFDFKCMLPLLGVKKNSRLYFITTCANFVVCVALRAVCPVVVLLLVFLEHNPLSMDYVPLGVFFMNVVFFSMINGWLVKNGFHSLKRRWRARRILQYLRRNRLPNNLAQNAEQTDGMEMNNLASSLGVPRNVLPVIIPSDENFRLAPPVSNFNMTPENAQVSNISLSRRERTVPHISMIIQNDPRSSGGIPSAVDGQDMV